MKESAIKVLRTSTPKANKEHICAVCMKPISKGERYLNLAIKCDGKLVSRKTHLGCSEKEEVRKIKAVPGVPVTEEQFKKQVHDDTLTMLETFTFRENMDIAFTPLIITEVAWHGVFLVLKCAADNKISETKKLSRAVKVLRERYLSECKKDLDRHHIKRIEDVANEYIEKSQKDLMLLWFSVNNQLKKDYLYLSFLDLRTDACLVLVLLDMLREHNIAMDKLMASKLGSDVPTYVNPVNDQLKDCMEAFIEPAKFEITEHVRVSMKILHKNFGNIEYDVK